MDKIIKYNERISPDASINLWYHWTGITLSGSSSRNLFRTLEIVAKSYPEKSTLITSARKQTNNYVIGTLSMYMYREQNFTECKIYVTSAQPACSFHLKSSNWSTGGGAWYS
jgi:hypothetical protein